MLSIASAGQVYKDFIVTKHLPLAELQCILLELTHQPSGARVIHIANDDSENLFCLSFRTLPYSSNGVAHILEHTVLCGSHKYPVKDPFFSMSRRSLNTFMNALTGQDFTCYPASSQIEQDFYNLLEVYIDAVFHPELKEMSFLQEGHRLEFAERDNPNSPLQFHGVVYNEMKGSLASIDSRLWRAVNSHLFSDLPYAYNTGGNPKDIVTLTHEELIEFHRNFYHPSRCLFFFYGDLPLSKHLDFLTEKILDGALKLAPLPPLPLQVRLKEPIKRKEKYPIAKSMNLEKQTIHAYAWLTAHATHQSEALALTFLDCFLMDNDASPLRRRLLDSGLCTQTFSSIDVEMSEIPFLIVCKGCEENNGDQLKDALFQAFEQIAAQPASQEELNGCLHQLEFVRSEMNADDVPFGLTLFMRSCLIAQHGCDPENGLLIHALFDELREKLKDPDFLPGLIYRYFLENSHFVQLTLVPDAHLDKEEAEAEKKILETIQKRLTKEEEAKIIAQSKELALYQEAAEHQSIDCLPKILLSDVALLPRDLALGESHQDRMKIFHHPCFTNKILYADLLFDVPHIPFSDLPFLSFFTKVLTEVGSGGRNYEQTLKAIQGCSGGIDASISLHITQDDPDKCQPTFSLKGKSLSRNREKLFDLFADFIETPDFTDTNRLSELLAQHATSLQNRLTKNALNYATLTALSGFSHPSAIFNEMHGLPYYFAVMQWMKNPRILIEELLRIQKMILGVGTLHLVLSCDQNEFEELRREKFYGLGGKVGGKSFHPWKGTDPLPDVSSQVRFIASPVAFTVLGMRTAAYQDPASPFLLLAAELFQNVILHKEIREKGGAYGSEASYTPTSGNFYFYSYRDPHLARTEAIFYKAIEKIASAKFKEKDLEEAKLGVLQNIDAPIAPGSRAMTAYAWKRAGRTLDHRIAFRKSLLSATCADVAKATESFLIPTKKVFVSFLGESLYQKEKKSLIQPVQLLPLGT
ncbi:MAG TPA: insulinase family protein [Chlamydiales bacterium]|nr:insulinase family protein [Chlamydiales bacterium]